MSVAWGGCWLGPTTVMLAEADAPFPPSVEVTALVVVFCTPVLVAVTFAVKLHEALSARVVPARLTLPDAATAVIVPPPQLPVKPLGVEMLGFDRLKVSDVLPFNGTLAAPNTIAMVGGNLAGGGGGLPDEPPPQATFQRRPTAMERRRNMLRDTIGSQRVIIST